METKIIQTKGFFELEEKYGTHDGDIVRVLVEIDYEKKSVHIKPRFGGDHFIFKNQHIRLEMWSSLGKLIAEASEFAKNQIENHEAACKFQEMKKEISQLIIEPPHDLPTGKYHALWKADKVIIQNTIPPTLNFFSTTHYKKEYQCSQTTEQDKRLEVTVNKNDKSGVMYNIKTINE